MEKMKKKIRMKFLDSKMSNCEFNGIQIQTDESNSLTKSLILSTSY